MYWPDVVLPVRLLYVQNQHQTNEEYTPYIHGAFSGWLLADGFEQKEDNPITNSLFQQFVLIRASMLLHGTGTEYLSMPLNEGFSYQYGHFQEYVYISGCLYLRRSPWSSVNSVWVILETKSGVRNLTWRLWARRISFLLRLCHIRSSQANGHIKTVFIGIGRLGLPDYSNL